MPAPLDASHLQGPPVLAGEVAPPEFDGASAREATIEDAPAMLRVLEAAFPRWPVYDIDVGPLDHLRWKMETADGEPISPHDVVIADGEVSGVMLAWTGRGKIGSQRFVTDRATDLAIDPAHQGKRFARLINRPSEVRNVDRQDYFDFDTRSHAEPVLHMYGDVEVVRGVRVWEFVPAPSALAGIRRARGRRLLRRRLASALHRQHRSLRSAARSIEVRPIDRFDDAANELWHEAAGEFDIIRSREADVLNWRYLDPRAGRIRVLGAFDRGALVGYLAYRRPQDGTASVLDLLCRPGRLEVLAALGLEARRQLRGERMNRLNAWLAPGHPYEAALAAAGLHDTGELANVEFGTKHLERSPEALAILRDPHSTMHVTLGDFDWV